MEEIKFDFTPEQQKEIEELIEKANQAFREFADVLAEVFKPLIQALERFGEKH